MPVKLDWFNSGDVETLQVDAGMPIFTTCEAGDMMYVILEGQVELWIGARVFETIGPGEPFGELALIDREPRMASAVAKTACKLVPVSHQKFRSLVRMEPDFALAIMKVMADRLRRADTRVG